MRPRPPLVLASAALLYLAVAIWPFETETRIVGLGGSVIFTVLFAAERRARRRTRSTRRTATGGHAALEVGTVDRVEQTATSAMFVLVAALGIVGLALLARHDPVTTRDAPSEQAITAALAATHGGRATEVEVATGGGAAWEVDVIKPDGAAVDVRLDGRFGLVAIEAETDDH